MNPKVEELRRRFLPVNLKTAPSEKIFSGSQPSAATAQEQSLNPATPQVSEPPKAGETPDYSQSESFLNEITASSDHPISADAISFKNLDQAIEQLFEPAERCRENLAEIAKSSELFHQLTGSIMELFQSLEQFRDQMRKLSDSFANMRSFQYDLGALAESFQPVRALHHEVVQLTDAIRIRLAQVGRSLEPANVLRVRAAEFVQTLEKATELQAQFYDIWRGFAAASKPDNSRGVGTTKT